MVYYNQHLFGIDCMTMEMIQGLIQVRYRDLKTVETWMISCRSASRYGYMYKNIIPNEISSKTQRRKEIKWKAFPEE